MNIQNEIRLEDMSSRLDVSEGWVDVFLKMLSEVKTEHSYIYEVQGLYKGKKVGFQLELNAHIAAGIIDGRPNPHGAFVSDAVKLTSLGQMSNDFIKALAELYGVPCENDFTTSTLSSTVYSLNSKAVDLEKPDIYRLKVFLKDPKDELYSELFLNINTDKREIELHEKDKSYRETIIKILSMTQGLAVTNSGQKVFDNRF